MIEHWIALKKMQFFMGQRAGRELWMSKPKNVQDVDIEQYNHDIETVMHYIQQLEVRIDTLTAKAVLFDEAVATGEKMKRERDAAVEDLETMGEARAYCDTCLHNNTNLKEDPCSSCMSGYLINNWQWRGVEVE